MTIDWRQLILDEDPIISDPEQESYCFWCGATVYGLHGEKVDHADGCTYRKALEDKS